MSLKRPTTILSLCDGRGSWSQPYVDDDYDVIRWDLDTTGPEPGYARRCPKAPEGKPSWASGCVSFEAVQVEIVGAVDEHGTGR